MTFKNIFILAFVSFLFGVGGAFTYMYFYEAVMPFANGPAPTSLVANEETALPKSEWENEVAKRNAIAANPDFVAASTSSTNSVVFIKNISERNYGTSYFDWFFRGNTGSQTEVSSGSGVIFTDNGYIVTNNHVIDNADRLEVIHNKKTYPAELIGTDPSTDLAVLKIDEKQLPAVKTGSSKDLNVGEWVIAVGNPFNLTSTVTAGIVSAKGRNINILQGKFPIESFIQTDAAINPGNSGGALINKSGELVGINTAILSKTGSYAGYGFAVPVDIVKKIVKDIIEYGEVQKAFFGGEVYDISEELINRLEVKVEGNDLSGVLLAYVQNEGAAQKAGLRDGDIIVKIDDVLVDAKSEFDEMISYRSPGDKVIVTFKRDGEEMTQKMTLTNREGTTGILKREIYTSKSLGAELEAVSKVERDYLNIDHGVRISNITNGLIRRLGIEDGFIVTSINDYPIKEPETLNKILEKIRGRVIIRGVDEDGVRSYYPFYLR